MFKQFQAEISDLKEKGYCVLKKHFETKIITECRNAFCLILSDYLKKFEHLPNRGFNRHFLPMPFESPCFAVEFFFDEDILAILKILMGDKIVADQWGCDVALPGCDYQNVHVDYQRPLFSEYPDLRLPPYILIVSFGLMPINKQNGAIEIAAGTQNMRREDAFKSVNNNTIQMETVSLDIGDVLIRHPWTLHRGTPNFTNIFRALVSIRYVRHWYIDNSRETNSISQQRLNSLTQEERNVMRFPIKTTIANPVKSLRTE